MTDDEDRRVFIVVGLYRPDPVLLSRQLQSLASQTHRNIEILVCADGPLSAESRAIVDEFAHLPLRLREHEAWVGVHGNFARGLREAVAASQNCMDLFAFCDQDDVWHPRKLERQVASFADPQTSLCHSDARIVSGTGGVLAQSLFRQESRSRHASLADLLVLNSVSGMTAVFRRDVAVAAEPFPMTRCRYVLHDYWTALVASLLGEVRFIDEPLVDYAQHRDNVIGARPWSGRSSRGRPVRSHDAYLRKCYREFLWRRRTLETLRQVFEKAPGIAERLSSKPVRALFDCGSGRATGLALSLARRLRGEWRQADQIWRIWRGKGIYCQLKNAGNRPLNRA